MPEGRETPAGKAAPGGGFRWSRARRPLFLTDPFEGSVAASAQGQHVIAAAIASALAAFLGPVGR